MTIFRLTLAVLMFCSISHAIYADNRPIRVTSLVDFAAPTPPYRWIENCGDHVETTGSIPDFVQRIFSGIGQESEWGMRKNYDIALELSIANKLEKLKKGEIDFLVSFKDILQDEQLIISQQPIMALSYSIISNKSMPVTSAQFETLKDLKGGTISFSGQGINPSQNYLSKNQLPASAFASLPQGLNALVNKEIDYFVEDYYLTKIWEKENHGHPIFSYHQIDIHSNKLYLVTTKTSPYAKLMGEIDQQIRLLNKKKTLHYLNGVYLTKWSMQSCE